jgi:hypothetical protein
MSEACYEKVENANDFSLNVFKWENEDVKEEEEEEEEETFTFRESRHCDEGREEAMNCAVAIANPLQEDANPRH